MFFFSWCEQKTNPDTPGTVIMFRKSATWKIPRGKCSPFCLVKGFVCWDKRKGKQTESLKCVCVYCARDEGIASTSLLVCFSSLLVPPPSSRYVFLLLAYLMGGKVLVVVGLLFQRRPTPYQFYYGLRTALLNASVASHLRDLYSYFKIKFFSDGSDFSSKSLNTGFFVLFSKVPSPLLKRYRSIYIILISRIF